MSTPRPHQSWCSQSNTTMCNCRFQNGDDYIPGHHGPAPGPGACVFCRKRCWANTPCLKRLEATREGVAAPLEPTPPGQKETLALLEFFYTWHDHSEDFAPDADSVNLAI